MRSFRGRPPPPPRPFPLTSPKASWARCCLKMILKTVSRTSGGLTPAGKLKQWMGAEYCTARGATTATSRISNRTGPITPHKPISSLSNPPRGASITFNYSRAGAVALPACGGSPRTRWTFLPTGPCCRKACATNQQNGSHWPRLPSNWTRRSGTTFNST